MGVAVEPPLTIFPPMVDQLNIALGVEDEPFNTTEVVVHVRVLSAPAFKLGGVPLKVTMATSESEQPAVFVTVKV